MARSRPMKSPVAIARPVRHHLLADHKMSVLLSKVLGHELGARGAIRLLATSAWMRRNFARWMFEDEPRAIALTPSRWHRHLLHQPPPLPLTRRGPVECFDAHLGAPNTPHRSRQRHVTLIL